jgi:hypothetical protein
VLYYAHPPDSRTVGANIFQTATTLHQVLAWCKQSSDSIALYLSSGMGKAGVPVPTCPGKPVTIGADDFKRAGIPTVAAGSFCDRLENDRVFGEGIAKEIGCDIPPTHQFSSISDATGRPHA